VRLALQFDVSADSVKSGAVDLTIFKAAPGDVLQVSLPINAQITGDNLLACFKTSNSLYNEVNGVSVENYGFTETQNSSTDNSAAKWLTKDFNGYAEYRISLDKENFDYQGTLEDLLAGVTVSLTQVRSEAECVEKVRIPIYDYRLVLESVAAADANYWTRDELVTEADTATIWSFENTSVLWRADNGGQISFDGSTWMTAPAGTTHGEQIQKDLRTNVLLNLLNGGNMIFFKASLWIGDIPISGLQRSDTGLSNSFSSASSWENGIMVTSGILFGLGTSKVSAGAATGTVPAGSGQMVLYKYGSKDGTIRVSLDNGATWSDEQTGIIPAGAQPYDAKITVVKQEYDDYP